MSPLSIGVGFRANAPSSVIVALVERASVGLDRSNARLFTLETKVRSPALREAAERLRLTLIGLPRLELERAMASVTIRSPRVLAAMGVASVAEASALAGAGEGSRLLVPRLADSGATCAIAIGQGAHT